MTRLSVALITLIATAQSGPSFSAPQPDAGKSGAVEFCQALIAGIPEANLGECMSYVIVNANGFPSHDCDAFLENDPDLFYQIYDSYSDCVRSLK